MYIVKCLVLIVFFLELIVISDLLQCVVLIPLSLRLVIL
jgi:hypothetical protein